MWKVGQCEYTHFYKGGERLLLNLAKKYTEVTMIIISIVLLQISNLFRWDSNPIMGVDKICADILIVLVCCLV